MERNSVYFNLYYPRKIVFLTIFQVFTIFLCFIIFNYFYFNYIITMFWSFRKPNNCHHTKKCDVIDLYFNRPLTVGSHVNIGDLIISHFTVPQVCVKQRFYCENRLFGDFLWGPTTFKIRLYLALSVQNYIMADHLNCHPFYLGGYLTSSVPEVIIRMAKNGPTTQECFETVPEKVTSAGQ